MKSCNTRVSMWLNRKKTNDNYNPMFDPSGHFWNELLPYLVSNLHPSPTGW
jgi:hypothetical protein